MSIIFLQQSGRLLRVVIVGEKINPVVKLEQIINTSQKKNKNKKQKTNNNLTPMTFCESVVKILWAEHYFLFFA